MMIPSADFYCNNHNNFFKFDIESDWKRIVKAQVDSMPEHNEGVLDKASTVIDEIVEPVEELVEETVKEVDEAVTAVEDFIEKFGYAYFILAV